MKKVLRNLAIILLIVVLVFVVAGFVVSSYATYSRPVKYSETIKKASQEYKLDENLIMAVIDVESGFDKDAHSHMDARGLMQLLPDTAEWICEKRGVEYDESLLNDPEKNIDMGCYYLRYLFDHFDDKDLALAAYNGGIGNVESWLKDKRYSEDGKTLSSIPFTETSNYVDKVKASVNVYDVLYGGRDLEEVEKLSGAEKYFGNYIYISKKMAMAF